jgi:hypothetical protein
MGQSAIVWEAANVIEGSSYMRDWLDAGVIFGPQHHQVAEILIRDHCRQKAAIEPDLGTGPL